MIDENQKFFVHSHPIQTGYVNAFFSIALTTQNESKKNIVVGHFMDIQKMHSLEKRKIIARLNHG